MRKMFTTALLVGGLALVPVAGFAAQSGSAAKPAAAGQAKPAAKKATKAATSNHATTGVVKSVDASTLVITRSGKNAGDMTFSLDPSVQREGNIAPGARVSVRYREDGSSHVATAITARAEKQQASAKSKSKPAK